MSTGARICSADVDELALFDLSTPPPGCKIVISMKEYKTAMTRLIGTVVDGELLIAPGGRGEFGDDTSAQAVARTHSAARAELVFAGPTVRRYRLIDA